MKRKIFIIVAGIAFLIAMLSIANILDTITPLHTSSPEQKEMAGPYQITMQLSPNPPPTDKPTTLALQIMNITTNKPLDHASVRIENGMDMDPGFNTVITHERSPGTYITQLTFEMKTAWTLNVIIDKSGTKTAQATFHITT